MVIRLIGLVVMIALAAGAILYPTVLATEPQVEEPPPFPSHQMCPKPEWIEGEDLQLEEGEIMSIDKKQLRELIREVLTSIDLHSDEAEELLMLTSAVESNGGEYITQIGDVHNGGRGIFQMEKATEKDIWDNYLAYRKELTNKVVESIGGGGLSEFELKANLTYQIVMARIHYLRVKESLPDHKDITGMANYWKSHYNSRLGKGTVAKAIASYNHYVLEA